MKQPNRFTFHRSQERRVFFTEAQFLRFAACRETGNLTDIILGRHNVSTDMLPIEPPGESDVMRSCGVANGVRGTSKNYGQRAF
jgi:hypothetical protein